MKKINVLLFIALIFVAILGSQCNKSKESENNKTLRIGAILPLTGDNANYGKELKAGMEIALNEINQNNSKYKLEVIYEDDRAIPQDGVNAFKKLTEIDKVPMVIGGMFSSVTLAIAPIAEAKKIVLLSPTSSAIDLSIAGDYIFRIYPSDSYDGIYLANYCSSKLKVKNIAITYLQVSSTTEISRLFKKEFTAMGGNIIYETGYKEGETNFKNIIQRLKDLKPEAVFIPGYINDIALFLKQSKELGLSTQFVTISTFNDPKIFELASVAAEGTVFSTPYYNANSQDSVTKKFVEEYKKRFNSTPSIWSAYGYDVIKVAEESINNSDGTSEKIKSALYSINNFKGVTGDVTFDRNGDVNKQLQIMKVINGKFTPID